DLGLAPAFAAGDATDKLTFGDREPLVSLMQETPADKLLPVLVGKLKDGTDLPTLVTAAALANARTFGGQDYDGYHAFMALLASRSWAILDLAGKDQARNLLRQSVRFTCTQGGRGAPSEIQTLLPKLLDQYKLPGKEIGKRKADDAWIEGLSETVYGGGRAKA